MLRKTVAAGEYVIGREEGVDVLVDLPQISRKHLRLTISEDGIFVEDLGSTEGTFIGGKKIKDSTRIWPSQQVRIGDAIVEVHQARAEGAAPAGAEGESQAIPTEVAAERKYEIDKVLGQEGKGTILDTHDTAIRRDVALKVMLQSGSEEEVARFVEEAQITGQLEHPGIPPVYELGTDEKGQAYYTTKIVRGLTLAKVLELLRDGQAEAIYKYSLKNLLVILQKVCDAVSFAHSKGVIHRDLKPESINIGDHGEVLVVDWGLATTMDAQRAAAAKLPAGTIIGTPQYMAPEQARGEIGSLDTRTDIYALGTILYYILALRPPVNEDEDATVVKFVAEGRTDRLDVGQRYPHLPRERIPDPLAAVVGKAMALQPTGRYQRVEDLQADLASYQNATITEAEKVGPVRQFYFVVRRYKTVSVAAAIVIGASLFFGVLFILLGQRARHASARDAAVVANLRSKAPAFLKLAERENDEQRFENALSSIDATLALDPAAPRAYWERAWALLGLEKWADASNALKAAQQRDPAGGANLTRVLPAIDKMRTMAADPQRWKNDAAHEIFHYLQSAGGSGPAFSIATKLKLNAEVRRKLVDQKLVTSLGRDRYTSAVDNEGMVTLSVAGQPLRSLDAVRGLPIDSLDASNTPITEIEALRGLRLQTLILSNTKVASLSPMAGVPFRKLLLDNTLVRDLGALKNAPIEVLDLDSTKVYDLAILKGMPLRSLNIRNTVIANLAVLAGLPLESINLAGTPVADLSPLKGAPLKELDIRNCKKLTNFAPILALSRLERLSCDVLPKELAALRQSAALQTIEADAYPGEGSQGARPAATFWAEYDRKGAGR